MAKGVMRRKDLLLDETNTKAILAEADIATISTIDSQGQPYGVVVNHAFDGEDKVYFHSANDGHKLDNIRECPEVCITAISDHKVLPSLKSAYYRSVVGFGKATIVGDHDIKFKALQLIMEKFSKGFDCVALTSNQLDSITVVEITLDTLTGKRSGDSPEDEVKNLEKLKK